MNLLVNQGGYSMLVPIGEKFPQIHEDTFIADTAVITGKVIIGKGSSVWFGAVIRGDYDRIEIGEGSNIQDQSVLHVVGGKPVIIGDQVTVGHGAILHGCKIGHGTIIGMGAIILDGAEIGEGVLIGAGSLIPEGKIIPANTLVIGSPGKIVREFSPEDAIKLRGNAMGYEKLWREMYR
jgi:carbonic anhydrase/acetyltransferase-like protein (isoleucine patch superfamily)